MALPVQSRHQAEPATWHPVAELEQATRRLSRLLDEAWGSSWPGFAAPDFAEFRPPADLEETDDTYIVEVELPGVDKRNVEVELTGRRLTVSGERKERERTGILRRRTRTIGQFLHEVLLPGEVDEEGVKASLADGVLSVTVPKAASEKRRGRRIPVA